MENNYYHYTECGLDNIYLANGFEITKNSAGEEEIYIEDIHGLHEKIGLSLISKPGLLIGNEIRFIRHTIDFSQTTLAHLLGVDYQTVLGWEKNKWPIPKTADHYLKTIFFAYLKKGPVYELINEIANLSNQANGENQSFKLTMRIDEHEWHTLNNAA